MTKKERDQKTQEKVKAINVLCKQLEINIIPKQALTEKGFMENVLYYADNEKYVIDATENVGVPQPIEPPQPMKQVGVNKPISTEKPSELPPVEVYKNES